MNRKLIYVLFALLFFGTGYFTHLLLYRIANNNNQLIVDFSLNKDVHDQYSESFINALGLFYLYKKETSNSLDYKSYFDTLSYYKKNLLIHHVSDKNFLIFYKPSFYKEYDNGIFGFTQDSFYIFEGKSIQIKNYPVDYARRGTEY